MVIIQQSFDTRRGTSVQSSIAASLWFCRVERNLIHLINSTRKTFNCPSKCSMNSLTVSEKYKGALFLLGNVSTKGDFPHWEISIVFTSWPNSQCLYGTTSILQFHFKIILKACFNREALNRFTLRCICRSTHVTVYLSYREYPSCFDSRREIV